MKEDEDRLRKKYIAPDLYYESYVLSDSIAVGCSEAGITSAEGMNAWGNFFLDSGALSCINIWDEKTENENSGIVEGYCYWNGTSEMQMFTS
ncbi:MAG: hypothetical protein LUH40_04240 [Clostridiales bacterium]|nr:hypothetical protein [Clostridiales bacterium]